MNKFKVPMLIFAAVFVVSAAALFFFIKKDIGAKIEDEVSPPAWVHENGSSGKHPVSGKIVKSGEQLNTTVSLPTNSSSLASAEIEKKKTPVEATGKTEEAPTAIIDGNTLKKSISEIREKIVTDIFLDNLAAYIAENYHPAGTTPNNRTKGFSSVTFKGISTHFGMNLNGLMPEAQSINAARKNIWAELLAPGILSKLYDSDSKTLLNLIEEKGIIAERKFVEGETYEVRELSRSQRAEMFRTSASPLRHTSSVLTAISENRDLMQAMDSYFKAEKRVEIANGIFQMDLNQSQKSNSITARNKAAHSGKILKDAITVREKIKIGITDKIKAFCSGHCDGPDDSFYIAKWVYRRTKDNEKRIESILSGCRLLESLATQMEKRAEMIENNL